MIIIKSRPDGKFYLVIDGEEHEILKDAGCSLTRNANQSLPHATHTKISWDNAEWDTNDFWSISPNPTRIVVPATGKYSINAQIGYYGNTEGLRGLTLWVNGGFKSVGYVASVTNTEMELNFAREFLLNADDYIEIGGYQSSGGDLNAFGSSARTFVNIRRLS